MVYFHSNDGSRGRKGLWIPAAARMTGVGDEKGLWIPAAARMTGVGDKKALIPAAARMTGVGDKKALDSRCGENDGSRGQKGSGFPLRRE